MFRILIALITLVSAGISQAQVTDPVPWPLCPRSETHSLLHSYGDYHIPWFEVTGSNPNLNFHFGVDIVDPTPNVADDSLEYIYCVRAGFVTDVSWEAGVIPDRPMAHDNYTIVICDFETQQTGCIQEEDTTTIRVD